MFLNVITQTYKTSTMDVFNERTIKAIEKVNKQALDEGIDIKSCSARYSIADLGSNLVIILILFLNNEVFKEFTEIMGIE